MIDKEFVPYEQALALKELGFDEPCFGNWQDMKEETPWFSKSYADNQNQYYGQLCSAPTFSQAFMFFRKKYGLHHIIHCPAKNVANFTITGFNIPSVYSNVELKSYEEAELACLIKLIEIVKNK